MHIENHYAYKHILTHLINLIIINDTVATEMKTSTITPIYKNEGSRDSLDQYRPISVLNTFAKIFDRFLYNRIHQYLHINNLMNPKQHGFTKNRSTISALEDILNNIHYALDNNKQVALLCIDFSQAFDRIDRHILLQKINNILKNYLLT